MLEKIYKVEFMGFVNFGAPVTDLNAPDISNEPFLVRESELEKYREFGRGFRSIDFLGYMECPDIN